MCRKGLVDTLAVNIDKCGSKVVAAGSGSESAALAAAARQQLQVQVAAL